MAGIVQRISYQCEVFIGRKASYRASHTVETPKLGEWARESRSQTDRVTQWVCGYEAELSWRGMSEPRSLNSCELQLSAKVSPSVFVGQEAEPFGAA